MGAPVGSSFFFLFALLFVCLFVFLLLRHYLPLRTTPSFLIVPIFLALALPASIGFLVPIDLGSVITGRVDQDENPVHRGIWLPERTLLVFWRIAYWLTFVLTWVALPLLGEYMDSGYREPRDRFLYALRSNGRYQLMVLGSGTLGAVYFFLSEGFHFSSLKAMVMALAYAWGLLLAIYLMGHGLVALPRKLFTHASITGRLRLLQAQAPQLNDKLVDATEELATYQHQVAQLKQRKNGNTQDVKEWIDELVDLAGPATTNARVSAAQTPVPQVVTTRYLADLTRRLKRARHAKMRYSSEWEDLIQSARRAQAINDAKTSQKLVFPASGPQAPIYHRFNLLNPSLRYLLQAFVIPGISYTMSAVLAFAGVAIIWSELVKSAGARLSLINLSVLHGNTANPPSFLSQVVAGLWLTYMNAATLYSITAVKIWGNRALVRRATYPESATWYAGQVVRLTVPLSYNFITLLDPGIRGKTVFYKFLGTLVDITPLGKGFSAFFPIFVLLPVFAATFGLYGRIQRMIGFGDLMDDEDGTRNEFAGWREGAVLIDRELNGRGASSVGLMDAPRDSFDNSLEAGLHRSAPQAPYSDGIHALHDDSAGAIRHTNTTPSSNRTTQPTLAPPEDEGGFFEDFGRRVRNTLDSTDKPNWLSGIGERIKKPKWMDGDEASGPSSRTDGSQQGGNLGGWFGRATEGRLRL